jgi:hypothetical protein
MLPSLRFKSLRVIAAIAAARAADTLLSKKDPNAAAYNQNCC